jgi:hypothetical protein
MEYNVFVTNEEGKPELMSFPSDLKWDFINRFGLESIPEITEFESWLEALIVFSKIEKLNKV